MAATSSKAVLITGANVGLGKEVARQLALAGDFDRIYLACRNADSGRSAAAELERITGRSIFTVIRMDLTDVDSVRSALSTLDGELHSVVMNAGGTGGPTPRALTADGVTHLFGSNVLGHVVLLENLIDAGALTNTAVLVGSEAARGVRMMRMPRPTFANHSVEEFVSVIDGSFFEQQKFLLTRAGATIDDYSERSGDLNNVFAQARNWEKVPPLCAGFGADSHFELSMTSCRHLRDWPRSGPSALCEFARAPIVSAIALRQSLLSATVTSKPLMKWRRPDSKAVSRRWLG
jgi:NAD(P)-dependent dehydrogenase (short-subunit alcohol dehydrogenase family)